MILIVAILGDCDNDNKWTPKKDDQWRLFGINPAANQILIRVRNMNTFGGFTRISLLCASYIFHKSILFPYTSCSSKRRRICNCYFCWKHSSESNVTFSRCRYCCVYFYGVYRVDVCWARYLSLLERSQIGGYHEAKSFFYVLTLSKNCRTIIVWIQVCFTCLLQNQSQFSVFHSIFRCCNETNFRELQIL